MKKIFLALCLCGTFFAAAGQPTTLKMTLEQCIDYALQHNYEREANALNESATQDLYRQSKMERLPDLSAELGESVGYSKANSSAFNGSYGVNASIPLYQGNISGNIEKNKLLSEQSVYRTKQYDNELTIQILQAFLSALGNEELLKHQQSLLQASEEQVKSGSERFRLGAILESDYLLLQSQYATDKNNISETAIQRDKSLLTLKILLSIDPAQSLEIEYPDADMVELMVLPNEETVLKSALATLPDLRISRYNVDIAGAGVKIAKSGYTPTISLNGNLGSGHLNDFAHWGTQLSDRFTAQAGVTVSIPIYDRNRTKSNVTQSKISLEQAKLNEKQTELALRQTVSQEYLNVVLSHNSFETSKIKKNAYSASLNAYRKQYEAGSITTVELLQQQNNYINALNDYIQDKYGFMLKRKILDVYMGK
ncbi:MAG: TolC family protein [Prevotellaceae bacterium]|jgi:outer membrane protein|nr:TolC family protein [Prevotellaceae bacterium]